MAGKAGKKDKDRLISLAKASALYGFNQAYLATLARKGRLKAIKPGNEWLTTPADVEDFISSRKRRGVYRDDIQVGD
ncbi:MAG: helix-turn-helix domain-containing protein [Chloroflexi bacterium]|nr:helix-turn-helix domain-containing protein [Chloroflexota bacterium]